MSTVILVLATDGARMRRLSGDLPEARLELEKTVADAVQALRRGCRLLLVDADVFADDIAMLVTEASATGAAVAAYTVSPMLDTVLRLRAAGVAEVMGVPLSGDRVKALLVNSHEFGEDCLSAVSELNGQKWVGQSRQVVAAFNAASNAAQSEAAVLIIGERGVGKELLARVIHEGSSRAAQPFLSLNCGALDGNLAAELFGNAVEAAGHVGPTVGLLERAAGGTLFLDEITRIPAGLQHRLADAMNRGVYQRLGSLDSQPLRARIIAASHVDVKLEHEQGRFREELLYSFGVRIYVPPLRQRPEDIPLLAGYFLEVSSAVTRAAPSGLSEEALHVIRRHDWPGNVRQLRNAMERAAAAARGAPVAAIHLPPEVTGRGEAVDIAEHEDLTIAALERRHIRHVLQLTGGRFSEAADLLGIHRNTLRRKLEEYGI